MRNTVLGDQRLTCCFLALGGAVVCGADPVIHVAWDNPTPPVLDADYAISIDFPAFPDLPDVELRTGSDSWRIWSTDADEPDGIGDIGFITCPEPQNFAVTIADDQDGPGARHVRGIVLEPTDPGNWSRITGTGKV